MEARSYSLALRGLHSLMRFVQISTTLNYVLFTETDSNTRQPALIFLTLQPNATFWGCAPPGAMTPKFDLDRDVVQCTYPMFHHPMFTRSEVIVLTNKHTNPQTHTQSNKQIPLKTVKHPTFFATLRRSVISFKQIISVYYGHHWDP